MPLPYREYSFVEEQQRFGGDQVKVTLGESLAAAAADPVLRPTKIISQVLEQNDFFPHPDKKKDDPLDSEMLSSGQVKDEYGYLGMQFDAPVTRRKAEFTAKGIEAERRRNDLIESSPQGLGSKALRLGASFMSAAADPLNVASAFIPVVGEARFAGIGVSGARLAAGATNGVIGNAAVEPIVFGGARELQLDYGMADALLNVGFGGAIGAGAHGIAGKIGDIFLERSDTVGRQSFRDALRARMTISPEGRKEAFKAGLAQNAQGNSVRVEPIYEIDGLAQRKAIERVAADPFNPILETHAVGAIRKYRAIELEEGITTPKSARLIAAEKEAVDTVRRINPEVLSIDDIRNKNFDIYNRADPLNSPEVLDIVGRFNSIKSQASEAVKAPKEKHLSLQQFVASKKGIVDFQGEALAHVGAGHRVEGLQGRPKLVHEAGSVGAKSARPADKMGELATEAGYFTERPSVGDFLSALEDDVRGGGTRYTPEGQRAVDGVLGEVDQSSINEMGIYLGMTDNEVRLAAIEHLNDQARIQPLPEDYARAVQERPDLVRQMAEEHESFFRGLDDELPVFEGEYDTKAIIKMEEGLDAHLEAMREEGFNPDEDEILGLLNGFIDDIDEVDNAVNAGAACLSRNP